MADPVKDEARRSPRRVLAKLLPGPLLDLEQKVVQCKPIDLSVEGLSILTSAQLIVGATLALKTHNDTIALEVIWQRPDFGKQGLYRYGLRAIDTGIDLETLFRNSGCLK